MNSTDASHSQWWILENGKASGPYSHGFVSLRLKNGLSTQTPACRLGAAEWHSLSDWTEFQRDAESIPPPLPPSGFSQFAVSLQQNDFGVPGIALPPMAQAICVYGLFVSPCLWAVGHLSCLVTPPTFVEDSPFFTGELLLQIVSLVVGLVSLVLMLAGAVQLRGLKRQGLHLTLGGLIVDTAWLFLSLVFFLCLFAAAAQESESHIRPDDGSSSIASLILFVLALGCGLFELSALIWLLMNGRDLPLK